MAQIIFLKRRRGEWEAEGCDLGNVDDREKGTDPKRK